MPIKHAPAQITFGNLTISANLPMQLEASQEGALYTAIRAHWDELSEKTPRLTIEWSVPIIDIQYEWYPGCHDHRALHVDWHGPVKSMIASSAPVFCFYNAAGRNRFTLALSDVKTMIACSLGVHEEDGTLLCKVEIPLDATGQTHDYAVTLYRCTQDMSLAESLRRVSRWWEVEGNLTPMPVPEDARSAMYSCLSLIHI